MDAQSVRDIDAQIALFAGDAVLIDEGQTHCGTSEIRAWREQEAVANEYTTCHAVSGPRVPEVRRPGASGGNFPGETADLVYRFTVYADHILRLETGR